MTTTERGSNVRFTSKIIGTNAVGRTDSEVRSVKDDSIRLSANTYLLRVTTHGSLVLWDASNNRQIETPSSLDVMAVAKLLSTKNPQGIKVKLVVWHDKVVAIREDNDTN